MTEKVGMNALLLYREFMRDAMAATRGDVFMNTGPEPKRLVYHDIIPEERSSGMWDYDLDEIVGLLNEAFAATGAGAWLRVEFESEYEETGTFRMSVCREETQAEADARRAAYDAECEQSRADYAKRIEMDERRQLERLKQKYGA